MLAAGALVAVLCGLAAFEWSQASVAASIETELAEARQGAQTGRDGIDPAGRLLAMKADAAFSSCGTNCRAFFPIIPS